MLFCLVIGLGVSFVIALVLLKLAAARRQVLKSAYVKSKEWVDLTKFLEFKPSVKQAMAFLEPASVLRKKPALESHSQTNDWKRARKLQPVQD